jgi:hypothetical protein
MNIARARDRVTHLLILQELSHFAQQQLRFPERHGHDTKGAARLGGIQKREDLEMSSSSTKTF